MTSRQLYEYLLIELNKVKAPSLLLEDFIYFGNKTVGQYFNKLYNLYDTNQQKSDDLRVLKSTAVLTPILTTDFGTSNLYGNVYEVNLPDDYVHIRNCIVEYTLKAKYKCYNVGSKLNYGTKRLTADMFPHLITNYYMRPSYKNPYFYINNVNTDNSYPITEEWTSVIPEYPTFSILFGTPGSSTLIVIKNGITTTFTYAAVPSIWSEFKDLTTLRAGLTHLGISTEIITNDETSYSYLATTNAYVEGVSSITETGSFVTVTSTSTQDMSTLITKVPKYRYGNITKPRMEIRYGTDDRYFTLSKVYIDYFKAPQYIILTQEELDSVEDISQLLEFPDYICQEIVNELVKYLMENGSDPRLQTNIPVNQSIGLQQQTR